jgi:hypothetical protein
MAANMYDRAA